MGAAESKVFSNGAQDPTDEELLKSVAGNKDGVISDKYAGMLLDPVIAGMFEKLYQLVQHNYHNDMNYLTTAVAQSRKEDEGTKDKRLPVLVLLSKVYTEMLKDVGNMEKSLPDEDARFLFLGDDENLMKYFYWKSGSGKVPAAAAAAPAPPPSSVDGADGPAALTGNESPLMLSGMAAFAADLKGRDARMRYFQFKFAQATLFQAAFTHIMWGLAKTFVETTQAFHKARETAFGSVFKQMMSIVQKYTSADEMSMKDLDDITKIRDKMESISNLTDVRDRLEKEKVTSLKGLLKDLVNLDSVFGDNDPGRLLPAAPGLMTGVSITDKGAITVDNFIGQLDRTPEPKMEDSKYERDTTHDRLTDKGQRDYDHDKLLWDRKQAALRYYQGNGSESDQKYLLGVMQGQGRSSYTPYGNDNNPRNDRKKKQKQSKKTENVNRVTRRMNNTRQSGSRSGSRSPRRRR